MEVWDTAFHIKAANIRAGIKPDFFLDSESPSAEFVIPSELRKLYTQLESDHSLVQHCFQTGETKTEDEPEPRPGSGIAVTREEMEAHAAEVSAAKVAELQTWLKFKCFKRRPRAEPETSWIAVG